LNFSIFLFVAIPLEGNLIPILSGQITSRLVVVLGIDSELLKISWFEDSVHEDYFADLSVFRNQHREFNEMVLSKHHCAGSIQRILRML
jgi:hypothetical protein